MANTETLDELLARVEREYTIIGHRARKAAKRAVEEEKVMARLRREEG